MLTVPQRYLKLNFNSFLLFFKHCYPMTNNLIARQLDDATTRRCDNQTTGQLEDATTRQRDNQTMRQSSDSNKQLLTNIAILQMCLTKLWHTALLLFTTYVYNTGVFRAMQLFYFLKWLVDTEESYWLKLNGNSDFDIFDIAWNVFF